MLDSRKMSCTLVKNLCVDHPWRNNPLTVFGLRESRPIYRFEASAVKAMRPILTRELISIEFWIFYTLPFTIQHVALASAL